MLFGLIAVLACRLTPATGGLSTADLVAYVVPQLIGAFLAAGLLRRAVLRSGLGDGPAQSIAVLLAGLGAFEAVGVGLDAHHAIGAHGLLDHDGWAAIPIALGLGSALGLLACAASATLRRARGPLVVRYPSSGSLRLRRRPLVRVSLGALIARNLAGRAPPVLSR